jgi:hypothetical protein
VASMRIPEQHKAALTKLRRLSDGEIDSILSALNQRTIAATSGRELASSIAPAVKGLTMDDVERISDTLFSLYYVQADADVTVGKFASDVTRALRESGEEFTSEELSRFTGRLERLLSITSLSVASKAMTLEADHPNALYETKILTDIRPVFGASVDDPPAGFVITHTLKIEYHDEADDHRKFYVALDDQDLVNLKNLIERAQKKAVSLTSLMGKTGIRNLFVGKEKKV